MTIINNFIMATLFLSGLALYYLLFERLIAQWTKPAAETSSTLSTAAVLTGMRRRGTINALIAIAPILGLLGTVNGMIQTFRGLDGGQASQAVADGIHTALYSTEYGLALAIPAFLLSRLLKN